MKTNQNEILTAIDQLDESGDWIANVRGESNIEVAKRIKATPTATLRKLAEAFSESAEGLQRTQLAFANKEMVYRATTGAEAIVEAAPYDMFDESAHDSLTGSNLIEEWIVEFAETRDPQFRGLSKLQKIEEGLAAYYEAHQSTPTLSAMRDSRIVELAITPSAATNRKSLIRYFLESQDVDAIGNSILTITEKWDDFIYDLTEEAIMVGQDGEVKVIKAFGAMKVGDTFKGKWKQAAFAHQLRLDLTGLPGATSHPTIFYDKKRKSVDIPKQFKLSK